MVLISIQTFGIARQGRFFVGNSVMMAPQVLLNVIECGLCLIVLHNAKGFNLRFTQEAFPDIRFRGEHRSSQQITSIYTLVVCVNVFSCKIYNF